MQWLLDPWINYTYKSFILLESLCNILQSILGLSFSLFFYDIYTSLDRFYTEYLKIKYTIISLIIYAGLIFLFIILNIVFIYGNICNENKQWILIVSANLFMLTVCTLLLCYTVNIFIKSIKIDFLGIHFRDAILKIKLILLCTGVCYMAKITLLILSVILFENNILEENSVG